MYFTKKNTYLIFSSSNLRKYTDIYKISNRNIQMVNFDHSVLVLKNEEDEKLECPNVYSSTSTTEHSSAYVDKTKGFSELTGAQWPETRPLLSSH